jgi:hypothetical protein
MLIVTSSNVEYREKQLFRRTLIGWAFKSLVSTYISFSANASNFALVIISRGIIDKNCEIYR